MRVLEYIYDALIRLKMEHFESWLDEIGHHCLNRVISTPEFERCKHQVRFTIFFYFAKKVTENMKTLQPICAILLLFINF